MTADFTPEQAAKLAEFDAAPDAPEALRERVARAICESDEGGAWETWPALVHVMYRHYADAAIAVMRGDA